MSKHLTTDSGDDRDGEGWYVSCACGWTEEGLPDAETAMDVFGEHCYDMGWHDAGGAEQST
jgi:hypothetical protein